MFYTNFFFNAPQVRQRVCPKCGMTENELSRTGQVGCAECYKTFADILNPYIKRVHGSDEHKGRVPFSAPEHVKQQSEKELLTEQLESAIKAQEYEQAAIIRDKLRALEGGGDNA